MRMSHWYIRRSGLNTLQKVFTVLLLGLFLLPSCSQPDRESRAEDDTFFTTAKIPPFEFTDQNDMPFSQDSVMGKVYVADFFFTRCPNICPRMSEALKEVQDSLEHYPDLRIVSHTLDPKNDSSAALKAYGKKYGARDGLWYFLTGDRSEIYGIAEKAYFMAASFNDGMPENIIHSSHLILVDRNGVVAGYFDAEDPKEVKQLIAKTKKLLEG